MKSALIALALLCSFAGCARDWTALTDRRTCVVLSAGGPSGLAHVGALAALADEKLPIDCVTGTSMGALVGGLYASRPQQPVRERYQALLSDYRLATLGDTARNAAVGGALGGLLGVVLGKGQPWAMAIGAGAGAALAAGRTEPLDLERLTTVLDDFFAHADVRGTAIPYATFFQEREGTRMRIVAARDGKLAHAIGKSIANPFIFPGFDPIARGYVDPAADRMAVVPIDDTCRLFPDARLLAVNASGQDSTYGEAMRCPLLEVRVDLDAPAEALRGEGPDFDRVVAAGYQRTRAVLAAERSR